MSSKVTVYIANYNYGRFLNQAIQSVLDQTYANYELLIIDDGSHDDSKTILRKYRGRRNISIIFQNNKGLTVTNNIALRLAAGEYIMRLDADDYLDEHALELMVNKLDAEHDLALVFPDYVEVDADGNYLKSVRRHDFSKEVTLLDQPAHGACTMFRRSVLEEIGGYDESFRKQDGYDVWLKIIKLYRVSNINLPLFFYRQTPKSLSSNETSLLSVRARILQKHANKSANEKLKVLTIVPVRGPDIDSRSKPHELIGGIPLIGWTLEAAIQSQHLQDIVVSTPDPTVISYVTQEYKGRISALQRDRHLADINLDLKQTITEIFYRYREKGREYNAVLILNIDSPFRSSIYIDKCIDTMRIHDVDVVIGVKIDDGDMFVHHGKGLKRLTPGAQFRLERNDLFRRVGGFVLFKWGSNQAATMELTEENIGHIVLDQKAALSINTELDLSIARSLALAQ